MVIFSAGAEVERGVCVNFVKGSIWVIQLILQFACILFVAGMNIIYYVVLQLLTKLHTPVLVKGLLMLRKQGWLFLECLYPEKISYLPFKIASLWE